MSIAVTYQLPPYVARIANTHYRLDRGYTPYKLQDLGNYPLGVYSISGVNNLFNGNVPAVSSTNNSVTFLYSTNPGNYPVKDLTYNYGFSDINNIEFAYKPYDRGNDVWRGLANEAQYDPLIFDFDAGSEQDTAIQDIIEVVEPIVYSRIIANRIYGYAIVRLDQRPGFTSIPQSDPSGLGIVPPSGLDKIVGRYLIVINDTVMGDGTNMSFNIYPTVSVGSTLNISISNFEVNNPANVTTVENGHPIFSGMQVIIRYYSLYSASTGPGYGRVYPYRFNKTSKTKPATITLPAGMQYSPYRFYTNSTSIPFDLLRGLSVPPASSTYLAENVLPTNLLRIGYR